jgi:hypothetical protein
MVDDRLRYDRMVERALRSVVREALEHAAANGLPGDHHFYMTFATRYPGVDIPEYLKDQYPDEMTIVLQYQYYGLEVEEDRFSVTLSFSGKHERLSLPLAAITTFADPSVNFALQFQAIPSQDAAERRAADGEEPVVEPDVDEAPPRPNGEAEEEADKDDTGKVVTLDKFRKK